MERGSDAHGLESAGHGDKMGLGYGALRFHRWVPSAAALGFIEARAESAMALGWRGPGLAAGSLAGNQEMVERQQPNRA